MSATLNGKPALLGSDGKPLVGSDGLLVPHARSFATIINSVNRTYHYRWDEALRDSRINALAMRRDLFINSLLQERTAPTVNCGWHLEVEDDDEARQKQVKEGLTKVIEKTPRWRSMLKYLLKNTLFIGREGAQLVWDKTDAGWCVVKHKPVHGDKIQFQWDDTPVVMLNGEVAFKYAAKDKDAVLALDRGGWGLRLHKPEWRQRFIIHTHDVDDADYFEGELAGGVHGVGLRHYLYWAHWLQLEVQDWMLSTMESTGTMDLYIFNYETGNAEAKKAAEANAKAMTGKIALINPVPPDELTRLGPVTQIPFNTSGVEALKGIIDDYFRRDIERMIVGQSMSSGTDDEGSLGGTGRAEFARSTKGELIENDADNLAETLTCDLVEPAKRFNYPWADFPVRFRFGVEDPRAKDKLDAWAQVKDVLPIKADELREWIGATKPGPDDEVVGGMQPGEGEAPGGTNPAASPPGGSAATPSEPSIVDLYHRLDRLADMVAYVRDRQGHEHDESGRFASKGGSAASRKERRRAKQREARATKRAKGEDDAEPYRQKVLDAMKGHRPLVRDHYEVVAEATSKFRRATTRAAAAAALTDPQLEETVRGSSSKWVHEGTAKWLKDQDLGEMEKEVSEILTEKAEVAFDPGWIEDLQRIGHKLADKDIDRRQAKTEVSEIFRSMNDSGKAWEGFEDDAAVDEITDSLGEHEWPEPNPEPAQDASGEEWEEWERRADDLYEQRAEKAKALIQSYMDALRIYHPKHRPGPVTYEQSRGQPGNKGQFGPGGGGSAATPKGSLLDRVKAGMGGAKDATTETLNRTAGGRAVLKAGAKAVKVFKAVERPLMYAMHKSQQLAAEAARERGLSEQHVQSLSRVLAVADFLGGYAGAAAGGAIGGAVGVKVGSFMPTASVAYLAYSSARDPLATWRAAKKVAKETIARTPVHHSRTPEELARLAGVAADGFRRTNDPEWYGALLHAGLGLSQGDLARAVQIADSALQTQPQGPQGGNNGPLVYDDDPNRGETVPGTNSGSFAPSGGGSAATPKKQFHHEKGRKLSERHRGSLIAIMKSVKPGADREAIRAKVDRWRRWSKGKVRDHFDEARAKAIDQLKSDFGDRFDDEMTAVLSSRFDDEMTAILEQHEEMAHAATMHVNDDSGDGIREIFRDRINDASAAIHDAWQEAQNGLWDEIEHIRNELAGDRKKELPLGRYLYKKDRLGNEHSENTGKFVSQGGGGRAATSKQTAKLVRRILKPSPAMRRKLAAVAADTVKGRQLANQAHYAWERVVHSTMGQGWEHEGGTAAADVKGNLNHNSGKKLSVILDGKVIGSASQGYSVHDTGVRNKYAAAGANSLVAAVALNISPNAGENRGVYLSLGAGSFTGKESETVTRLLSSEELDKLETPEGQRLFKRRLNRALEQSDLKRYKAVAQEQSDRMAGRDGRNLSKSFEGAVKQGNSKEAVAKTIVSEMSDELKAALLKELSAKG